MKIVGYDADPEQIADLKKGIVQALVAQQPYQEGVDGVQQAVNAINGKPDQVDPHQPDGADRCPTSRPTAATSTRAAADANPMRGGGRVAPASATLCT